MYILYELTATLFDEWYAVWIDAHEILVVLVALLDPAVGFGKLHLSLEELTIALATGHQARLANRGRLAHRAAIAGRVGRNAAEQRGRVHIANDRLLLLKVLLLLLLLLLLCLLLLLLQDQSRHICCLCLSAFVV